MGDEADADVNLVLLEGELQTKRQTLSFLWNTRTFVLGVNNTFRRYDGDELHHFSAVTPSTAVVKVGSIPFQNKHGNKNDKHRFIH